MHLLRDLFSIVQTTAQVVIDVKAYPKATDRAELFSETINELHLYRRIRRPWTDDDKAAVTRLEATALATFAGAIALGDTWPQDAINKQLATRAAPPETGDPLSWRTPDIIIDHTGGW